jgi:hypothetical protein
MSLCFDGSRTQALLSITRHADRSQGRHLARITDGPLILHWVWLARYDLFALLLGIGRGRRNMFRLAWSQLRFRTVRLVALLAAHLLAEE